MLFSNGCSHVSGTAEPSDEEINAEAEKAYKEVKKKSKRSTNRRWTEIVNRVAARIEVASGESYQWEIILIESNEVNAWCMPGGKMAVYTGIMPVVKTEAALAAVLGHEVAHATMKHGKKRYARAIQENLIGLVVGGAAVVAGQLLCKDSTCKLLTGLVGAAAGFAVEFFNRKFSRQEETEADKVGQTYMAKAGYEPAESIRLWERMEKAHGGKTPPEWLSTHPSEKTRQSQLREWLPEANVKYEQASERHGLGESI